MTEHNMPANRLVAVIRRTALGLIVALAFFAIVEGLLWASGVVPLYERSDPYVGFAGFSPLFVNHVEPDGRQVYRTAPGKLRWFNPQQFPARKAPGTTRIFCLGGSTTYGRPYDDRTSFCGWLRAFLPSVDPERRWEVINAGGISYASYRVARIMNAMRRFEPDLFIVYTGHNEFLEERTYGRLLDTPEFVRNLASLASRLRLYSLLADVAYGPGDVLSTEVDAVLDRSVGPEAYERDDAMFDAVLDHFRVSLDRMVRIGDRAEANTIFVTPASNIGDFSPFKSQPSDHLGSTDIQRVQALKVSIREALEAGDAERAAAEASEALAIDPRDARLHYLHGRALREIGRVERARQAFRTARDEDVAPLRAPTPVRGIVSDVAQDPDVGLVDFAGMVVEESPDRIPDSNLFMDHVHPTVEGNRLLALAIIEEMREMDLVTPGRAWNDETIAEITALVESRVDEEARAMALRNLTAVLTWAGKHEEAARLNTEAMETTPEHAGTYFQRATLLVREGRFEEALPFTEEAVRLSPDAAEVRIGYGVLLTELGRLEEARRELETAVRLDPTLPGVYYELGVVLGNLGLEADAESAYRRALEREPADANVLNNLGVLLAQRGDIAGARDLFERAVRSNPDHADAAANLAQARAMLGR